MEPTYKDVAGTVCAEIVKSEGLKFDNDKHEWDLMPFTEMEKVVEVLMHGAKKYAKDNWQHVDNAQERYMNAAMRHVVSRMKGDVIDPEFKLPHTAHAICCLLFLMWFDNKE